MTEEKKINEKIFKLTNDITNNYPELIKYLNELNETIPIKNSPSVDISYLKNYYESLINIVKKYKDSHPENLQVNANSDLVEDVNSLSLSYNYAGEGKIPILFLHGFPFDKSMWKEQVENLKDSYCVIALDIRGFGKSKDEKSHLSMDLFADDIVSFMDKRKIQKAVVCGLSMGGFIALNFAKRFPEKLEALILSDTQCIADTEEVKAKRMETIEDINSNGSATFKEKFVKSVFHPDSLENKKELVFSLKDVVFANSDKAITSGLIALAERSETCSSLAAISVPTLIICGREDAVTPLEQSQFMHDNIKGSVLKIIEKAGHVSNLEHPEEFNLHLREFLLTLNALKKI